MVRRWSRINEFNFTLKNKKLFFFKKSSKSRVFKLTVSTRKFFKKYSKFRRRAFNRLRHRSNWLLYSNNFKFWAYDYINTKTFSKKSWMLNIYTFSCIVFNWSSVKNLNLNLFFNLDYNLVNLNSFFLKQDYNFSTNFFFWNNVKNSSVALSDEVIIDSLNDIRSLFFYENYFYEVDNFDNFNFSTNLSSNFFFFFTNNDMFAKQQTISFYKNLTLLTLLDL